MQQFVLQYVQVALGREWPSFFFLFEGPNLRMLNTYMLLACWEVRIVKNCDRGLENAARGHRPRAAFSSPRSQFFTIWTDPKPDNNMFIFFSCGKLAYKWVCFHSFVIELAYVPSADSANHL